MNKYKFRHFYKNKYLYSPLTSWKRYYLSYDYKHKALWYRNYKVATRTIDEHLKQAAKDGSYIYRMPVAYKASEFKDFFKFAFVRNPLDRLISAWRNQVIKNNTLRFSESKRQRMQDFGTFVEWLSGQNVESFNPHFILQREVIDLNHVDFLGRMESFDRDFKLVCEEIGLPLQKVQQKNRSSEKLPEISNEVERQVINIYKLDYQIFYPQYL